MSTRRSAHEETLDPEDWGSMRALGHKILDDAMDYIETLRDRPVWQHAPPEVKSHFEGPPPSCPESPATVYKDTPIPFVPTRLATATRDTGGGSQGPEP